jgi:archaellum component FlaF (FlaF/FlaG flagellin family)
VRRNTIIALSLLLVSALVVAGWASGAAKTRRVSVSSAGAQGNGNSDDLTISKTGRYVAFSSLASNLVPGDTNGVSDIFVRDRLTGKTTRVSVSSAGVQGNAASTWPSISGGGRFVAFQSNASNLVPGDANAVRDIFVRDRKNHTTKRISASSPEANGASGAPSISADGRFVAFDSSATTLVPGDTNAVSDVFVRDRKLGTTRRMSRSSTGAQGNELSSYAAISGDGRFVAFASDATNFAGGDTNTFGDIYVRDRKTGTTRRVSVRSGGGQADSDSYYPALSGGGRYVAFESSATNLVSGDSNVAADIFVRDRKTGKTRRVSVRSGGTQGNLAAYDAAISGDGRFVVFTSNATNLVSGDSNLSRDVFVRDRLTGKTKRVSVSSGGGQGTVGGGPGKISADGRFVAFNSFSSNLVSGDTNVFYDIFVRGPLR